MIRVPTPRRGDDDVPRRPQDGPVIPVVAPPLDDSSEQLRASEHPPGLQRIKAPAGGARNAFNLVTHERATWREAVLGSAFLLGAATAGGVATSILGCGLRLS